MTTIGKRITEVRKKRGMTIARLAKQIGTAPSTLREWEQGRLISGEPYVALADALGITVSELITGKSEKFFSMSDLQKLEGIVSEFKSRLESSEKNITEHD